MIIETIQFNSFKHFCNEIIPNNIVDSKYNHFAFRGQASSEWHLLPKVLRLGGRVNLLRSTGQKLSDDNQNIETLIGTEINQIRLEYLSLSDFYINANENGLYLPFSKTLCDSPVDLYDYQLMFQMLSNDNFRWLPQDMIEIAALAQHSGLPTRMLDFSFNIFTALYFASYEACETYHKDHNGHIVIWAIDYKTLRYRKYSNEKIPLYFSVPIYANNPNLKAQKGLFAYWETTLNMKYDFRNKKPVDLTPIDSKLNQYKSDEPLLYKFLIPKNDCVEVFDLLFRLGYHAAILFPGYNGIVRMLKEKTLLNQLKTN